MVDEVGMQQFIAGVNVSVAVSLQPFASVIITVKLPPVELIFELVLPLLQLYV